MQAEEVAVISRDLDGKYHVHTSHTGFSTAGGAIWGGTSALFMMIEHVTPDKAIAALDQYGGTVIKTSLSDEDAKKLQDALQPRSTTARS